MKKLLLLSFLAVGFSLTAQNVNTYNAKVANHYFSYVLKLTKEGTGFTPPVAARAFGFTGLALYEALVPGMPSKISSVGRIPQLGALTQPTSGNNYHWPTVANNVLAVIIDSLWDNASQANKDSLHNIQAYYNTIFQGQISSQDYIASRDFGIAIALDIYNFSKGDGGHKSYASNFPVSYVPPTGPGYWAPFGSQTALQPYWGSHRPFITKDTSEVIPGPPPSFSTSTSSAFYTYAYQVYNQVKNNTTGQVTIAQYWADGTASITPPGHSISMLTNLLKVENADLERATIAYAKMGIAMSEAFLACWKTKYKYNCLRPVTYIQANIDNTWVPLIGTPPFPEYSSGHSSQSGAMSEIMESIFGSTYPFTDSSHGTNFGGPRSFQSFDEAAEEAAISRLYGGIHYQFGNNTGLEMGRKIGANVNELFNELTASTQPLASTVNINLYPNPASQSITIYSTAAKVENVEIIDFTGRRVMYAQYNGSGLDISTLPTGVYAVNIFAKNNSVLGSKSLIKQ